MVAADVLGASVDGFREVVYYYRLRQSGELSISQRTSEMSNNEQRMAAVRAVGAFLADRAPELKPVYDRCVLEGDLAILVSAFRLVADTDHERLLDLASDYLATVDESVDQQVHPPKRRRYHLIRRRILPAFLQARQQPAQEGATPRLMRRGLLRPNRHAAYPHFNDRAA